MTPSLVLVPGFWLGAWAWDEVGAELADRGFPAQAVTLPGREPGQGDPTTTIEDQADGLAAVVAEAGRAGPVVLVAHSGGNLATSVALDRDPAMVSRVIYVDSGPAADGLVYDPTAQGERSVPLPPFDVLGETASLAGLSTSHLDRFRERAVPEPGPVVGRPIRLDNDARLRVPTTLICSSISAQEILRLARDGHPLMTEVNRLEDLTTVDLPTGHWPMWSQPVELACAIADAATAGVSTGQN